MKRKKRMFAAAGLLFLIMTVLLSVSAYAGEPASMTILKRRIVSHGTITRRLGSGSNRYVSKISYQKKGSRFLFQCTYTNGRSSSGVKMLVPASKIKASYTVDFNQTVRAAGLTAKMSGKAGLRRASYSNQTTNLRFSRKNKTSASKKITNSVYQSAANSLLRVAFGLWEAGMQSGAGICFVDLGFDRVTLY